MRKKIKDKVEKDVAIFSKQEKMYASAHSKDSQREETSASSFKSASHQYYQPHTSSTKHQHQLGQNQLYSNSEANCKQTQLCLETKKALIKL